MKHYLKSYAMIFLGAVTFGLAVDWFFVPNQVAMGGVTGLAQAINAVVPALPVGVMMIVMNVPLFLAGWKFIGGHMLVSSLFAMVASSLAIDLIGTFYSFAAIDPMLACLCGGALMGVGLGVIYAQGAATGGSDIVARLVKLKKPWMQMGRLILILDFMVLSLAAVAFGRLEAALYGVVALFVSTQVMDTVLYGMNTSKVAYVITDHWQDAAKALMGMERGVTILRGEGAYTGDEKRVLLVAFKQREIVQVKRLVHDIDPRAFLIVLESRDVLGKGFGEYKKEEI